MIQVSTLDEPVSETIMRDVRAVGGKLKAVLLPLDRSVSLLLFHAITKQLKMLGW